MTGDTQNPPEMQVPNFTNLEAFTFTSRCVFRTNLGPIFSQAIDRQTHRPINPHVEIVSGNGESDEAHVKIHFRIENGQNGQVTWDLFTIADIGNGPRWRVESIAFEKVQDSLENEFVNIKEAMDGLVQGYRAYKDRFTRLTCCTLKVTGNDAAFGMPYLEKTPYFPNFDPTFQLLFNGRKYYMVRIWFVAPSNFGSHCAKPFAYFCQQRVLPED